MFKPKNTLTVVLCLLTISMFALNSPLALAAETQQRAPLLQSLTTTVSSTTSVCNLGSSATKTQQRAPLFPGLTIKVSPATVNRGRTVTITGHDFTPNGTVDLGTTNSTDTATADDLGNFAGQVSAPEVPGIYTITAIDQSTSHSASAKYRVIGAQTHPRISAFPRLVNPSTGVRFTVSGKDFTPDGTVNIYIGNLGCVGTVASDAQGYISGSFVVSLTLPGTYTITAVDAVTWTTASTTLIVR